MRESFLSKIRLLISLILLMRVSLWLEKWVQWRKSVVDSTLVLMWNRTLREKLYIVRQVMRRLVYTMIISNNRALFHLRWKKNLVKHQKVSKYDENDCLQNVLSLFISLFTAPVIKTVIFRLEFTFSF